MCNSSTFDYGKFVELDGLPLSRYMDQLLSLESVQVSDNTMLRVRDELPIYDEIHIVYAIYFGAKQAPELFAHLLPHYLGEASGSVWAAAYNSLHHLPDKYVTSDLVESVRQVLSANPGKEWIAESLAMLVNRLAIKGPKKRGHH